jgi:acetone carboxylase alpha subunit
MAEGGRASNEMKGTRAEMGIADEGRTLLQYLDARAEGAEARQQGPLPLLEEDPTKVERLYWSMIMACEWAREKAKLISSSPGAITGELLLFVAAADGRTTAASWGLCGHAGALRLMVRTMAEQGYDQDPGTGGIQDGDVWSCNDPVYGSSQNNDIYTTIPVFYDGELVCWATGSLHHADVGSVIAPMLGGVSPTTYTDGLTVPPMRTGQNFQQSKGWELMLRRRTRTGVLNVLDDKMKLVGALLIRDRMLELIEENGVDYFKAAMDELVERDRREIAALNKAWAIPSLSNHHTLTFIRQKEILKSTFPFAADDFFIHLPVACAFEADGTVRHDYSGATSQRACAYNCSEGAINLATYCDFPVLAGQPSVSGAIFDIVKREAEPGTIMNPDRHDLGSVMGPQMGVDAGSSASHAYALARFCRGFVEQAWAAETLWNIVAWEGEFANGNAFASADWTLTSVMPLGVAAWRDAVPAMVGAGNAVPELGEAEEHELIGPTMVYLARTLQPNVMAHGKFRGAVAFNLAYMCHNPGGHATLHVDGTPTGMTPTSMVGMCGGYPTLPYYTLQLHRTNARDLIARGIPVPSDVFEAREMLASGVLEAEIVRDTYQTAPAAWPLADGDLVYTVNEASSSWGEPLDRDPERVLEDVAEGWLEADVAASVYGVVIECGDGWAIDAEATTRRRQEIRDQRLARAVPAREWWEKERARTERGDVPLEIAEMYADCLRGSEKFRGEFEGCWGVDAARAYLELEIADDTERVIVEDEPVEVA